MNSKNTKGLKDFREFIDKMEEPKVDEFLDSVVKNYALRYLSLVIPATEVEENETVKYYGRDGQIKTYKIVGNALKNGWTGGKEREPEAYVKTLPVTHFLRTHRITVFNPVEYAPYVEYGHVQEVGRFVPMLGKEDEHGVRTGATLKKPFVKGQHMAENSRVFLVSQLDSINAKLIDEWTKKNFK